MKRIIFDEETISAVRAYSVDHTLKEACNKFTLKCDTMKRLAKENDIHFIVRHTPQIKPVSQDRIDTICNLFANTDTDLHSIRDAVNIRYSTLLEILHEHFTEEEISKRKSKLYRKSKLGDKNPMTGKCRELHPNYKGVVADGKGYLMCLKPEWYTGRVGSKHIYLHSAVFCENAGLTEIPKGYVVHHIDGNKHNNTPDNLALITNAGHTKLHAIQNNLGKVQRSEKIRRENETPETPDND